MGDRDAAAEIPRYAAITLGNGWSGIALSSPSSSGISESAIVPPTTAQWGDWLSLLVQGPGNLPGVRVLKTSKTVEVLEAQVPQADDPEKPLQVICKQSKVRGAKDAVAALFRPSAARRSFGRAQTLHKAGIGTATPLAWLERRSPRASWLITEFLDGVTDLDAYVLTIHSRVQTAGNRRYRNALIHSLTLVFRNLERANLYHRDMKASNILLAPAGNPDGALRACIVDLDGLAVRRSWRSIWKPIVRLAASLLQYPSVTRTDYARFLREYLIADGHDRRAWRCHFQSLRKKAARYSQAAHKRKSSKLDGYTGDVMHSAT